MASRRALLASSSSSPIRIFIEPLERRTLLAVELGTNVPGLTFSDTPSLAPPNARIAVGPTQIIEVINGGIAVYSKDGALLAKTTLRNAFAGLASFGPLFHPQVSYDDVSGRFVVGVLDLNWTSQPTLARLLFAVSRSSDLTAGFADVHAVAVGNGKPAVFDPSAFFFEYDTRLSLGWNYDSYVFAYEMRQIGKDWWNWGSLIGRDSDLVAIDKSSVLDNDPSTLKVFHHSLLPGGVPLTMHGSQPGDPMVVVANRISYRPPLFPGGLGDERRLGLDADVFSNLLSDNPTRSTFTAFTEILSLGPDPGAPQAWQPGDTTLIMGDATFSSAAYRDGRLVVAFTAGEHGDMPQVAWEEWDTNAIGASARVNYGFIPPVAAGQFDPAGAGAFASAIEIAPNGDIGLSYMQSGHGEFPSMYFTGRKPTDPPNTMQEPRLVKAGEDSYRHETQGRYASEYGGLAVDPVDGTFWGVNAYATTHFNTLQARSNWGTWLGNFALTASAPAADAAPAAADPASRLVSAPAATMTTRTDERDEETASASALLDLLI